MIRAWKCRICNHVYFGVNPTDRCPFCGVHGTHISPSSFDTRGVAKDLSEQTKADLQIALKLEYEDANHYKCAAETSKCPSRKMIFDTLYEHEINHAHIIEDLLGLVENSIDQSNMSCIGVDISMLIGFNEKVFEVAVPRERSAIMFYNRIANETSNERVKEVFRAIADAEYHHSLIGKIHG